MVPDMIPSIICVFRTYAAAPLGLPRLFITEHKKILRRRNFTLHGVPCQCKINIT
jgi:hypothetical protein